MKIEKRLPALLLVSLISFSACASESSDYARMGRETWEAFECSALAGAAEMFHEQGSLADHGFEQGKAFFDASLSGRISGDDFAREVPLVVTLLSQGPTADFMLGRIYEGARRSVLQDILSGGKESGKAAAKEKYTRNNCARFAMGH